MLIVIDIGRLTRTSMDKFENENYLMKIGAAKIGRDGALHPYSSRTAYVW